MTALIDGEGSRTEWAYDSLGRLTQKTYADGTDYDYTYDDEGRLTSRTDATGLWTWTYDGDSSRVLTVTGPDANVVTYSYDPPSPRWLRRGKHFRPAQRHDPDR